MIIKSIIIIFSIFGIKDILFNKNGIENSLKWIIIAFCFGYRTFSIIPGLILHPIEMLIYACIIRIIISGSVKLYKLPISISILSSFFITVFFIDCLTIYWKGVLIEFKNAILLLLVFFVVQHINFKKSE